MLPVPLLKPSLEIIKCLATQYHCTIVLCTATQPALSTTETFKHEIDNVHEIIPDPASLYEKLRRVRVEELLQLSALQHLIFCERQCAFIHIEQLWYENKYTAQGQILYEKVHSNHAKTKGEIQIEYGVYLRSLKLGLTGKADVVEYYFLNSKIKKPSTVKPVEYKRGKPKLDFSDSVQLCAQALCIEGMLEIKKISIE